MRTMISKWVILAGTAALGFGCATEGDVAELELETAPPEGVEHLERVEVAGATMEVLVVERGDGGLTATVLTEDKDPTIVRFSPEDGSVTTLTGDATRRMYAGADAPSPRDLAFEAAGTHRVAQAAAAGRDALKSEPECLSELEQLLEWRDVGFCGTSRMAFDAGGDLSTELERGTAECCCYHDACYAAGFDHFDNGCDAAFYECLPWKSKYMAVATETLGDSPELGQCEEQSEFIYDFCDSAFGD